MLLLPVVVLALSACGNSEPEVAPLTVPAPGANITVAPAPSGTQTLEEGSGNSGGASDISPNASGSGFEISSKCSEYLAPVLAHYRLPEEKRLQQAQLESVAAILGSVSKYCSGIEYARFLEAVQAEIGG